MDPLHHRLRMLRLQYQISEQLYHQRVLVTHAKLQRLLFAGCSRVRAICRANIITVSVCSLNTLTVMGCSWKLQYLNNRITLIVFYSIGRPFKMLMRSDDISSVASSTMARRFCVHELKFYITVGLERVICFNMLCVVLHSMQLVQLNMPIL